MAHDAVSVPDHARGKLKPHNAGGAFGTYYDHEVGRHMVAIVCSGSNCRKAESLHLPNTRCPDKVRKEFGNIGWDIRKKGGKAYCPDCVRRHSAEERAKGPATVQITAAPPPPNTAMASAMTDAAVAKLATDAGATLPAAEPVCQPPRALPVALATVTAPISPTTVVRPVDWQVVDKDGKPYGTAFHLEKPANSDPQVVVRCCVPGCTLEHRSRYRPDITWNGYLVTTIQPRNLPHWAVKNFGAYAFCPSHAKGLPKYLPKNWDPSQPLPTKLHSYEEKLPMTTSAPAPAPVANGAHLNGSAEVLHPKPSADALKLRRKAIGLLDEHFDADKGVYRNGYSDERISKESGLALAALIVLREQNFGELKALMSPEAVAALVQRLTKAETTLAQATKDVADLKEITDAAEKTLADCQREICSIKGVLAKHGLLPKVDLLASRGDGIGKRS
ncbi:MAG: hypothetical protein WAX89_08340 [Alphaproteobacteria bacterium]